MTKTFLFTGAAILLASPLWAQDTTRVNEGVRIGVDYSPGTRPGLVVVPGVGLESVVVGGVGLYSVRTILRQALHYTDRFEMFNVADLPVNIRSGSSSGGG